MLWCLIWCTCVFACVQPLFSLHFLFPFMFTHFRIWFAVNYMSECTCESILLPLNVFEDVILYLCVFPVVKRVIHMSRCGMYSSSMHVYNFQCSINLLFYAKHQLIDQDIIVTQNTIWPTQQPKKTAPRRKQGLSLQEDSSPFDSWG